MKTLRQSNIREFFHQQPVNVASIKPGMLLSFRYASPDGVHDPTPLIYVLSKEGDRVWGLNLHYNFTLMAEIYNSKLQEVNNAKKNIRPTTQTPNPNANEDILSKVPKLKKILPNKNFKPSLKKPKAPIQKVNNYKVPSNLDIFTLIKRPDYLLRNYLFIRLKSLNKLIYKL